MSDENYSTKSIIRYVEKDIVNNCANKILGMAIDNLLTNDI